MKSEPGPLRIASWNVHRAVGRDGRFDPVRILCAIRDEIAPHGCDILLLQEADAETPPHAGLLDLAGIEAATGLCHIHDGTLKWSPESHGFHGNVVFVQSGIEIDRACLVDLPGVCQRGAVAIEMQGPLRLVAAHLGLAQWLRAMQLRTIAQFVQRSRAMPTLIAGDLNEWRPWGGCAFSARVFGRPLAGPVRPSFPSGWPVLPLDRVLADRPGLVRGLEVLDGPLLRTASDHRPVIAEIAMSCSS